MKYRTLNNTELEALSEGFKHFLIVNGIHNKEWRDINTSNIPKAKKLVELFSDVVLQKVYEKMKYIEHRSNSSCQVFKLDKNKIEVISLNRKPKSTINLSTPELIHSALVNHTKKITFFKSEKKYLKERETEIHEMIEKGCVNSTKEFWDLLHKII